MACDGVATAKAKAAAAINLIMGVLPFLIFNGYSCLASLATFDPDQPAARVLLP